MAKRLVVRGSEVLSVHRTAAPGPRVPEEEVELPPPPPELRDAAPEGEPAAEPETDPVPVPAEGVEGRVRHLLDELSDEHMRELSEAVSAVATEVQADQAQDLVDGYSDFVEAAMSLKAALSRVTMSAIPSRQIQKQMEEALRPLLEEVRPFEAPLT